MVQSRRGADQAPQPPPQQHSRAPALRPPEQELARLRAENKALRATEARLSTERDILRSAAKYFAGETNW
ncbi:hypothetical protein MTY81_59880 [Mycolicibacterium sp. TY81]|nr:hypothetical protein MTY81_59880 [Mycolicibacterium sp. TY81]